MDIKIENGYLLLAEPFMMDDQFKRAVVLVCDRHIDGTVGFIMNKPMQPFVYEILEDFPNHECKLHFGGPVSHDTIHFLHNRGDIIENSMQVDKDLYWGGDYDQLKECFNNKLMTAKDIRFFVGYAGWSAGQLEEELSYHSWVISKMDPQRLFTLAQEDLWSQAMNDKGGTFQVISDISEFSNLN